MHISKLSGIFNKHIKLSFAPAFFVGVLVFATVISSGVGPSGSVLVQRVARVLLGISYVFLVLNILYNSWYLEILGDLLIVGAVFVFCLIRSGLSIYLTGLIVVVALRDVLFSKILKSCFWGCASAWAIILLWWMFIGMDNTDHGLALGFNNPNQAGFFILYLFLIGLYQTIDSHQITRRQIAILYVASWCMAGIVLALTDSKTSAISFILLPILVHVLSKVMYRKTNPSKNRFARLVCWAQPVLILFTYLSAKLYTVSKISQVLDKIFTNRIFLNWWAFGTNPLTLFGNRAVIISATGITNPVHYIGSVVTTIDSAYTMLLLGTGIIPTFIMSLAYVYAVWRALKNRDVLVVAFSIIFCLYAFMETLVTAAFINFVFLYIFARADSVAFEHKKGA